MRVLKHIRVVVSLVFLVECVALVWLGRMAPAHAEVAGKLQIVMSMIAASAVAALLWLPLTIVLGRVYCSSVCPLGTLQDVFIHLRRRVRRQAFRYRKPRRSGYIFLGIYIVSVVAGVSLVPLLLEPWPAFANIVTELAGRGVPPVAAHTGAGALAGLVCGIVSVAVVGVYALFRGRDFCNEVCPVGTALGLLSARAVCHIEFDPDRCTACLKCQDECKASCIDVATRRVDNERCVRCFNCVAVCDEGAIRYQPNRNSIITPLMRRQDEEVTG